MIQKIKQHVNYFIYLFLFIIIGMMWVKLYESNQIKKNLEVLVEEHKDGLMTIKFYDQEINNLKKTNKELYDSIESYKDEIDYLIQFKYNKEYIIDTVFCNDNVNEDLKENVYEYSNQENDTLKYKLTIGSIYEPNWYKINFGISEQFTIINKKHDDLNVTTIKTETSNTTISDVTVFNKKDDNFLDRFKIGPSVTAGYDVINKNFGIMFGFSLIYDIPLK